MREIEPGRFRRVVASPRPSASSRSRPSPSCGGRRGHHRLGGEEIPVAWEGDRLVGVEGVIDKDFAASLLARRLHAHKLIIVTDVEQAAIRFGRPGQQWLGAITLQQAREYWPLANFRPGRWDPRLSRHRFRRARRRGVYHYFNRHVARAVRGETGTHIVAS